MVAGGAGLEPPRPGEVAGEHATDALPAGLAAEQGTIVRGLERQLLAALGELGLDHGQRGARAGAHHQLLGLVEADSGETLEADHRRSLHRPAEAALAAQPGQLDRLLLGRSPCHQLPQLGRVAGSVRRRSIHAHRLPRMAATGHSVDNADKRFMVPARTWRWRPATFLGMVGAGSETWPGGTAWRPRRASPPRSGRSCWRAR